MRVTRLFAYSSFRARLLIPRAERQLASTAASFVVTAFGPLASSSRQDIASRILNPRTDRDMQIRRPAV